MLCPDCESELTKDLQDLPFCPYCQLPLQLLSGKYRILKKLEEGGFGAVYLAEHIRLNTKRVIKTLKNERKHTTDNDLAKEVHIRFDREIRLTAELSKSNEHIVRIDDVDVDEHLGNFYVMEFLEGQALVDFMEEGVPLDTALSFHLFRQLCNVMGEAHLKGIVHRDLKPENIFLIERKRDPYFLKLIDFGVAKSLTGTANPNLTQGAIGTAAYMAPEQCMGETIDHRTDIYALGIMFYELLTGYLPFDADPGPNENLLIMRQQIQNLPEPICERFPNLNIPEGLDQAILHSLEKKPAHRFQSAEAFWNAVKEYAPGIEELKKSPYLGNVVNSDEPYFSTLPKPSDLPTFAIKRQKMLLWSSIGVLLITCLFLIYWYTNFL